jgi:hypothetical protein
MRGAAGKLSQLREEKPGASDRRTASRGDRSVAGRDRPIFRSVYGCRWGLGLLILMWGCTVPNPAYERVRPGDGSAGSGGDGGTAGLQGGASGSGSGGSVGGSGGSTLEVAAGSDADRDVVADSGPGQDASSPPVDGPPPDLAPDLPPDLAPDLPPDLAPDLPIDGPVPVGTGLKGEYFDGSQFEAGDTGDLEATVIGEAIDHDWGTARPHSNMDFDWFSVRWTGKIMPFSSGTYTFRTTSDDGIRVWIDGNPVIDHYMPHTAASQSGTAVLTAYQQHTIKVEYFEQTGSAVARLYWSGPNRPEQIVPRANLFLP